MASRVLLHGTWAVPLQWPIQAQGAGVETLGRLVATLVFEAARVEPPARRRKDWGVYVHVYPAALVRNLGEGAHPAPGGWASVDTVTSLRDAPSDGRPPPEVLAAHQWTCAVAIVQNDGARTTTGVFRGTWPANGMLEPGTAWTPFPWSTTYAPGGSPVRGTARLATAVSGSVRGGGAARPEYALTAAARKAVARKRGRDESRAVDAALCVAANDAPSLGVGGGSGTLGEPPAPLAEALRGAMDGASRFYDERFALWSEAGAGAGEARVMGPVKLMRLMTHLELYAGAVLACHRDAAAPLAPAAPDGAAAAETRAERLAREGVRLREALANAGIAEAQQRLLLPVLVGALGLLQSPELAAQWADAYATAAEAECLVRGGRGAGADGESMRASVARAREYYASEEAASVLESAEAADMDGARVLCRALARRLSVV